MSPSEFDLRAVLRDGEGGRPDVDAVIAEARARRAQRRVRLLSTAAAVAVVAGTGVGVAELVGNSGGSTDRSATSAIAGSTDKHAVSRPEDADAGAGTGGSAGAAALPPGAECPATFPGPSTGGGRAQIGGSGPLYAGPVTSLVVCAYGSGGGAQTPARLVLNGDDARRLATSLENAATTRPKINCPDLRSADARRLAMIGISASNTVVGTVTATVGVPPCDVTVTNGTAVRYDWSAPADLQQLLLNLTPINRRSTGGGPSATPTGTVGGSPIHS